jgi:phospholipid N-methyltransferase
MDLTPNTFGAVLPQSDSTAAKQMKIISIDSNRKSLSKFATRLFVRLA